MGGTTPRSKNTNIQEFGKVMMQYQPIMNRFMNQLVNVWALQKIDKMYFTSPFSFAKRGMLEYGETIESVWVKSPRHILSVPTQTHGRC